MHSTAHACLSDGCPCSPVDGVREAGVVGVQLSAVGQDLVGKPATNGDGSLKVNEATTL
jgi:hypothetical protein